jgi:hypothetical protein
MAFFSLFNMIERFLGHVSSCGAMPAGGSATPVDDVKMTVLRNVMVPMRDDVMLATDIYLPAGGVGQAPRFPVILERTPYDKTANSRSELSASHPEQMTREEVARYFVRHGYAVIYQDCRGRHRSQGKFAKYLNEGEDGYDTCAWIVAQSWCNGKIGTMGLSYAAHTQAALGSLDAPGVAAMFLDSGGFSNAYQGGIKQGGAFELKQVTWAIRAARENAVTQDDQALLAQLAAIDLRQSLGHIHDWRRGNSPLSIVPEYEDYLFDQWQHGNFDAYWKRPGIYAEGYHAQFSDAPMVHMSSWYDAYARTATDNYVGLKKHKRGPVCLIMGPWIHGNRSFSYSGDVDFGPQALIDGNLAEDFLDLRRRWFDQWLKNPAKKEATPSVRLFVMGGGSGRKNAAGRMQHGGHWRDETDWPLPGTQWTPYYLHRDGRLAAGQPAESEASLSYLHDPRHPVPTVGGAVTSGEPLMFGGAFDQREGPATFGSREPYRPLAARPDVLVFETAPLTQDMEVTGPVTAELWISSDRPDTDFNFKLVDVYPPNPDYPEGFAMNLTDGVLRCRYRDSWEHPTPMQPGEIYRIRIDAFPTSNLFKQGHKIRIDISSSNFPRFDINPNTGGPEGTAQECVTACNRIHLDRQHASHIVLPLIPARRG